MLGEGPYPGSTLDRLADGRGLAALDPAVVWRTAPSDLRLALWLSLYRGAAAERAWDARVFRMFALLEAMAGEAFPQPIPVFDAAGAPVLNSQGTSVTTATARGATYMLVRRGLQVLRVDEAVLCADTDRTLWEEVGVWVDVRNTVAHEGVCRPAPAPTRRPATRARTAAAFERAAILTRDLGGTPRRAPRAQRSCFELSHSNASSCPDGMFQRNTNALAAGPRAEPLPDV